MIETVVERALLAALAPSDVAVYSRATGWQRNETSRYGPLWTFQVDGDEFEMLTPEDSTFGTIRLGSVFCSPDLASDSMKGLVDLLEDLRRSAGDF